MYRPRHDVGVFLLRQVVKDFVLRGYFLALLGVHIDWMVVLDLLGHAHSQEVVG